jgi:hypothetical protein
MDMELHVLAAIDHGPIIRAELLKSLTGQQHWAADASLTTGATVRMYNSPANRT